MKINTRKFGEIDIDETKILAMPGGLPGFKGFERFILLKDQKTEPFCWFQSVEEPNLALVIMDPAVFKSDYHVDLKKIINEINWDGAKEENLLIYVVINISGEEENKKITANLMGPLVINLKNNEAVQVVIPDSTYSHQYNILEPSQSE